MHSVLPPELETKRLSVVGKLRLVVCLLAGGVFGSLGLLMVALLALPPAWRASPWGKLCVFGPLGLIGAAEFYAIYRLSRYSDRLCREAGLVCPHCGSPLLKSRFVHLDGRCPKCGRSVLPHGERPVLATPPGRTLNDHFLSPGTRIRFRKTLTTPATPGGPSLHLADEGESGEITGQGSEEAYWVKTDTWPQSFGAWVEEFETLPGTVRPDDP